MTSSEDNWAMATANMHKKSCEIWTSCFWEMWADRQTDKQTDKHTHSSHYFVLQRRSNTYFSLTKHSSTRLLYRYSLLSKQQQQQHPFNNPLSMTTRISWYQKGKTKLDFTEAIDSKWQWHQLGHMHLAQTDNHGSTHHSIFLQAGCHSCRPTNSVKALKALSKQSFTTVHAQHMLKSLPTLLTLTLIYHRFLHERYAIPNQK